MTTSPPPPPRPETQADLPPEEFAAAFERLYAQAYLQLHRRDGKRNAMSGASRAVLLHLAHTGPLTVGEAAKHLDRAQSVVSDIVTQLESKGLLAREADPADRRRTLVWLTPEGRTALDRERSVLSADLVTAAADRLTPADRAVLLDTLRRLVAADDPTPGGEPA
ncbi:MarR family winged helix-turn-helix transcriptional regulator [Cellulomonas soli]|uniref:MarR family winged helix-turn-helix transcriptional regulator n=1 Tax=Cellulomonas soli TaxID=931535 RepID=UPI003F851492